MESILNNMPQVQKLFLARLTDAAENNDDREKLFSSQSFQELLASNLFYIYSTRLDYNPDSIKDVKNVDFLSNYIWATIKTTPTYLLVSLILSNIEFRFEVELSDYHQAFGRDVKTQEKQIPQSSRLILNIPLGNIPC